VRADVLSRRRNQAAEQRHKLDLLRSERERLTDVGRRRERPRATIRRLERVDRRPSWSRSASASSARASARPASRVSWFVNQPMIKPDSASTPNGNVTRFHMKPGPAK
jgi:hypothetical protein